MEQRKGLRRSISTISSFSINDMSLVAPEVKQLSIRSQSKALVSMRYQSSIFYRHPQLRKEGKTEQEKERKKAKKRRERKEERRRKQKENRRKEKTKTEEQSSKTEEE